MLQERLKREYKAANKTREGYIDESEEEDDGNELSTAGKDMRKLMKKLEKNGAYDESDDEKNPYASSVRLFAVLCLTYADIYPRRRRNQRKSRRRWCKVPPSSRRSPALLLARPRRRRARQSHPGRKHRRNRKTHQLPSRQSPARVQLLPCLHPGTVGTRSSQSAQRAPRCRS